MPELGKKPKNKKFSTAIPDADKEEIREDGPGMGITFMLLLFMKDTSLYPGSDIRGVPASLTKATLIPELIISKTLFLTFLSELSL